MHSDKDIAMIDSKVVPQPQTEETSPDNSLVEKKSFRRRFREIIWDSLDRTPEERWFIHKIDFFILTWASLSYFSKNLNTNNVSKSQHAPSVSQYIDVGNADMGVARRQCLCFRNERRPEHRRQRIPDAHDDVDDVRLRLRALP